MPNTSPAYTVSQLAQALNGQLDLTLASQGNGDFLITRLCHPQQAQLASDVIMVVSADHCPAPQQSFAQTWILPESLALDAAVSAQLRTLQGGVIRVPGHPRVILAKLLALFSPPLEQAPGIHPTAIVPASCQLGADVSLGAYVVLGEHVRVGAGSVLLPHVSVGAHAQLGEHCLLHSGVRIGHQVILGSRVIIQPNAVIGGDGFSFVSATGALQPEANQPFLRLNSLGTVRIGDDVEVGANTTIDRANLGETTIGSGTKIDNLTMIGHNNSIGQQCLIVSQVGIAGSCTIQDRVVLAGQVGLKDHITIGEGAIVGAQAGVMHHLPGGQIYIGSPAEPQREFFAKIAEQRRMKELRKTVTDLKARLSALESQLQQPVNH